MAFCEHCGRELSDQAIACPNCGHPRAPAVVITTREGTRYADWWQRALAALIDGILVLIIGTIVLGVSKFRFMAMTGTDQFGADFIDRDALRHNFVGVLAILGIGIVYRTLLEGTARGQSIGK